MTILQSIKPRKIPKGGNESTEYNLCRRLEEYYEFAYNTKNFSNAAFYLELLKHIEKDKDNDLFHK